MNREVSGWGGYPKVDAQIIAPATAGDCGKWLDDPLIARGKGRSYGDSASSRKVLQTTYLDHFIAFDETNGVLGCEAGVSLREVLRLIVPKGWFLPVTPGTSYVSIGGAIASDVHGKNHHHTGTLGEHVRSLRILLGTGETVVATPTDHPELFHATCGGMGLTGIILDATLQLIPIASARIDQTTIKTDSLEALCEAFEAHAQATYSVAWIDCVRSGKSLGRSVLRLGEHAATGGFDIGTGDPLDVPMYAPSLLINKLTVSVFNSLYYAAATHDQRESIPMLPYFYPLDSIGEWRRLYGKPGFVQYQFVVPYQDGVRNMRTILARIAESGAGSALAVLKLFREQNDNHLSFPMAGYSLALDFRLTRQVVSLFLELDAMVVDMGGRIYLTKDALMSESTFKRTYGRWQEFEEVRASYGAIGKFASSQSRRLGLA